MHRHSVLIWGILHHHGTLHLPFDLRLHFGCSLTLFRGIQNTHGFEVQGANTSHKNFLQVFLHHVPISVLDSRRSIGLHNFLSEILDFFLVCCTNTLELLFDSSIKLFLISLHFHDLEILVPGLENISEVLDAVFLGPRHQYKFGMHFEVPVVLERSKAFHLHDLHPSDRLSFS